MSVQIGLGTIAGLLGVLVAIELAQLGVLGSTWVRSRSNQRRIEALLSAIGVDPEDPPSYELTEVRTDGGEQD
jgi:hypothetical protein